jgi:hypothetical protein
LTIRSGEALATLDFRSRLPFGEIKAVHAYLKTILSSLDASDPRERAWAIWEIDTMSYHPQILEALDKATKDEDAFVRLMAVLAIGRLGKQASKIAHCLLPLVHDSYDSIRRETVWAIGDVAEATQDVVDTLVQALQDPNVLVRGNAAEALSKMKLAAKSAAGPLLEHLDDTDPRVRQEAADTLSKLRESIVENLCEALEHPSRVVRRFSVEKLGALGEHGLVALPRLERMTEDDGSSEVRISAEKAVAQITGHQFDKRRVVEGRYPSVGDVFDGWIRIVKQVGHGAEAFLYKCVCEMDNNAVGVEEGQFLILKYYHPTLSESDAGLKVLQRAFDAHDRVYELPVKGLQRVIHVRNRWAAILEWVEGRTLREEVVRRGGSLPEISEMQTLARCLLRVIGAIIALHRRGLVFRDLKPENIVVSTFPEGHRIWTIIDTGLLSKSDVRVSVTNTPETLGTPLFAPPELLEDESTEGKHNEAVDIYSVGATLYSVMTGEPMFKGGLGKVLRQKLSESGHRSYVPPSAINPAVDEELETIITKCAEFHPSDRYDSLQILFNEIESWSNSGSEDDRSKEKIPH